MKCASRGQNQIYSGFAEAEYLRRSQSTIFLCQSAAGGGCVGRLWRDDAALRMGRLRSAALRVLTEERIFRNCILAGLRPAGSHCENSGSSDGSGASARSGRAKQRSLLCPLSENLRPIPTKVPCGHFWRHLSVTKGGENCSSQEMPNRRCGMLPDIHSGCFRRFHTPILLKLTIVKDSLFDCGRRAAARSRPMRRAASFRHRRSKHSPPAAG